jgi:hypothetical protein
MFINFLLITNLIIISHELSLSHVAIAAPKEFTQFEADDDLVISDQQLKDLTNFVKNSKFDLHYLLKETLKKLPACDQKKFLHEVVSLIKQQSIEITLLNDRPQNSSYYIDPNFIVNKFISQNSCLYLKKMIKAGFALNFNNLQHAVMCGNAETNQLILDNVDFTQVDKPCLDDGSTILIFAIKQQRPISVLKTLINHHKIDIAAVDSLGNTANYYANDYLPDNSQILELLEKKVIKAHKAKRSFCCCLTNYFANKYQNLDD